VALGLVETCWARIAQHTPNGIATPSGLSRDGFD